ncbi:potassium-transporting ATPase subunit F [Dietzia sp.]
MIVFDVIAALAGIGALGYLLAALVSPERF